MQRTRFISHPLATALIAALVLASPAAADRPVSEERIVGGTPATRDWPAQGYLRLLRSDGVTYACGGTLVSGRWFLTAAHCVTNTDGSVLLPSAFQITLGRPDRTVDPPAERDTVDSVIVHAAFDRPTFGSDLALLHISSPTAPGEEPLGIVRASESSLWAAGTTATVIGWGRTSTDGATTFTLREAPVPIVSDPGCAATYGSSFDMATMVCAGDGATDTCQGDSGGPLMVPRAGAFVLAGITSFGGASCADPQFPGVYTRLGAPAFNTWVRDRIPTASISVAPAAPEAGEAVRLSATSTAPAGQTGSASYSWDLDGDGAYDDATGPTAAATAAGTHAVRVQARYPDGDRAVQREVVTVGAAAAPPPAEETPAAGTPAATTTPPAPAVVAPTALPAAVLPRPAVATPALPRLVDVRDSVRLAGLLDRKTSVRVACATACHIKVVLRVDRATARRAGLTGEARQVTIGSGSARFTDAKAGGVTITLTRGGLRALRRARRGALLLDVTVTARGRDTRLSHVQRLRP